MAILLAVSPGICNVVDVVDGTVDVAAAAAAAANAEKALGCSKRSEVGELKYRLYGDCNDDVAAGS